jgi:hypothetical protein
VAGIAVRPPPPTPRATSDRCSGATNTISDRLIDVNLDALGHEGRKATGFVIIEVQVARVLRELDRVSFAM